jgi:predicted RNase H-like HicB family nuclease
VAEPAVEPDRPPALLVGTRRAARAGGRLTATFGVVEWAAVYWRPEVILMRYRVAIHRSEEGVSVSVPGLPGCWSQGATEDEAIENIRDAIREYLSVVEEQLRGEDVREVEVTV